MKSKEAYGSPPPIGDDVLTRCPITGPVDQYVEALRRDLIGANVHNILLCTQSCTSAMVSSLNDIVPEIFIMDLHEGCIKRATAESESDDITVDIDKAPHFDLFLSECDTFTRGGRVFASHSRYKSFYGELRDQGKITAKTVRVVMSSDQNQLREPLEYLPCVMQAHYVLYPYGVIELCWWLGDQFVHEPSAEENQVLRDEFDEEEFMHAMHRQSVEDKARTQAYGTRRW
ncbi:MAG: hypothetical protein O2901_11600 [Verrucomicrobia bacterium]|nr:hypothetical protein [Verrucomicrobiota bacterium]